MVCSIRQSEARLVRVGGPNAGHQVFAQPRPEKYFHLPSGTGRAPNVHLLLGAGAVIYVPKLQTEIAEAQIDFQRLSIDPQAMIIEDADRAAEAKELGNISSTAQPILFTVDVCVMIAVRWAH